MRQRQIEGETDWGKYAQSLGLGEMSDREREKTLMTHSPEDVLPGLSVEQIEALNKKISLALSVAQGDM